MKIYNETKTQEIINPDLTKGYMKKDTILIRIEPAVAAILEQGHYETIAEYPETKGKDVRWIVDIPAVSAREAKEIYEDIQVFTLYTITEIEDFNKARRQRYIEAYRNYQAAVNYGEFERVITVDSFIDRLRSKDWTALIAIPPQIKYFTGEVGFTASGLVKLQGV